jgi:hypothetical protein
MESPSTISLDNFGCFDFKRLSFRSHYYEKVIQFGEQQTEVTISGEFSDQKHTKLFDQKLRELIHKQEEILIGSRWKLLRLFLSYRYIFPYTQILKQSTTLTPDLINFHDSDWFEAWYPIPSPMVDHFGFAHIVLIYDMNLKVRRTGFDG